MTTKRITGPSSTVHVDVPHERIRDLLCCALEGGSNYWYYDLYPYFRDGVTAKDINPGGELRTPDMGDDWGLYYTAPFVQGCGICLRDGEDSGKVHKIGFEKLLRGLRDMARECPRHWGDFLSDNEDATTGDVFLQCCIFGKIMYG